MTPAIKDALNERGPILRFAVEVVNEHGTHIKGSFANPQAAIPTCSVELIFDPQAEVTVVDLDDPSFRLPYNPGGTIGSAF